MSEIWKQLCTYEALKDGWHLAEKDLRDDFLQIPFLREQFAFSLKENLHELARQLKSERFNHRDVIPVKVAKGNLSTRPGGFIPLESRIVLFAAIKLVAPQLDCKLSEGVFSYRVKDNPNRELFIRSSLDEPPFLKKKTITRFIDPFNTWYEAWPNFEHVTKECIHRDYLYLATSDISAYFENIQLEILRDQLLEYLPDEQQVVNLFLSAFEAWTTITPQGRRYFRGIPQGSDISRFFGNLFLAPVDQNLEKLGTRLNFKYYRYMDDVRIFAKKEEDAKKSLLALEAAVRQRHLNLQSAKTKIYNEKMKEVSHLLVDSRLTRFDELEKDFTEQYKEQKGKLDAKPLIKELNKLQKSKPDAPELGEQKIYAARKPLTGLSDRLFRRITNLYMELGNKTIIPRLLSELERNSDRRYTKTIVRASKIFPRLVSIQTKLLALMQEHKIQPSQEAEFLHALRYQSRVSNTLKDLCMGKARNNEISAEVRVQALMLVARTKIEPQTIQLAKQLFEEDDNIQVKRAAALILASQRGKNNTNFIYNIAFHPNNELRQFGKYLRACKTDEGEAKKVREQAFKDEHPWLLADYMPLLFLQSQSNEPSIVKGLKDDIHKGKYHKKHSNMDMRDLLTRLLQWMP